MDHSPRTAEAKESRAPKRQPPQSADQDRDAVPRAETAVRLQSVIADPRRARPADVLQLQRAAGNRAVSHLIQAKLTVGPAGDQYEQEADRVANQVLTMPMSRQRQARLEASGGQQAVQRQEDEEEVQTKPLAAGITPLIQRQEDEEEVQTKPDIQRQEDEEEVQTKPDVQRQEDEEEVQTKPDVQRRSDGGFDAGPKIENRLSALKGSGSPLPAQVRTYMEPRFGADFSGVRLHAGREAAQMNTDLRAQAFTHGQDIYLGTGAPGPGSEAGNRLLAHELTHTIQQTGRTDRIARWGLGPSGNGTSHTELTNVAVAENPVMTQLYGKPALDYLANHADHMDKRADYLLPVGLYMGGQSITRKRGKGMYQGSEITGSQMKKKMGKKMDLDQMHTLIEDEKKARAKQYDAAEGYNRSRGEAPNHAEDGMYRDPAAGGRDRARIKEYRDAAVAQWKAGDTRQSLFTLALALHTAQDVGAHGHGHPGTGHDPRKFFPPPNEYAETSWIYNTVGGGKSPDIQFWWCDNKDKNFLGWEQGKVETWKLLNEFNAEVGGGIPEGWTDPGWLKRNVRGLGRLLGGRGIIKHE